MWSPCPPNLEDKQSQEKYRGKQPLPLPLIFVSKHPSPHPLGHVNYLVTIKDCKIGKHLTFQFHLLEEEGDELEPWQKPQRPEPDSSRPQKRTTKVNFQIGANIL